MQVKEGQTLSDIGDTLKESGVDYRKVSFVEAAFPQHGDLLRGGTLDAVVSADPFMSRITDSGAGYVASYYSTFLPEGQPTQVGKPAGPAKALRSQI